MSTEEQDVRAIILNGMAFEYRMRLEALRQTPGCGRGDPLYDELLEFYNEHLCRFEHPIG